LSTNDFLLAAVRALHIGSAMLLVAFPLFALFIWRPEKEEGTRHGAFCRTLVAPLTVALAVEIITGAAWLWLTTAMMCDDAPGSVPWTDLGTVLTQTRFGLLWIGRGVAAVLLGILLAVAGRRSTPPHGSGRWALIMAFALGGALLGSLAWAAHAAAGVRWQAWHLTVDVVHLLAGAVWPVGLVPFFLFLWRAPRRESGVIGAVHIAVVRRFSQASFAAVLAMVVSGVANSWLMLPSWAALLTSFYGRLLVAKVLVVAVMIGLGALNKYRFLPALARESPRRLMLMVAAEAGLTAVVLVIVGMMGMAAPPS
jgi:putative copper resistance protein D